MWIIIYVYIVYISILNDINNSRSQAFAEIESKQRSDGPKRIPYIICIRHKSYLRGATHIRLVAPANIDWRKTKQYILLWNTNNNPTGRLVWVFAFLLHVV